MASKALRVVDDGNEVLSLKYEGLKSVLKVEPIIKDVDKELV